MNDRFKFRVWDNQRKKYEDDLYYEAGDLQVTCVNKVFEEYISDGCIVEQCTGIKDKNGKLIYEGDIVKSGKHIYPVKWYVNGFAVNDGYDYLIDNEEWEVIGNIHENKELLDD